MYYIVDDTCEKKSLFTLATHNTKSDKNMRTKEKDERSRRRK